MKKLYLISLALLCPLFLLSQEVEVEGGFIADSIDVQSGLIKNLADPISAQDAATKAYVDHLEARIALLTAAPIATDDYIPALGGLAIHNADVLNFGTPDEDPDGPYRYGNFIEITSAGSTPGSNDNLSIQGCTLAIDDNDSPDDKTDDFIAYTPLSIGTDSFYYVITDRDNLKDTALVEITNFLPVQQRLDDGETPFEIYTSFNGFLDSLYGKPYQGGLITYLNTITGTGLIAATEDQGIAEWGCSETNIGVANQVPGAGQLNTSEIISACNTPGIAARICDDLVLGGYNDWFLPSIGGLNAIFDNLYGNGLGDIDNSTYWSSSEVSSTRARSRNAIIISSPFKTAPFRIRAVRAF